MLTERTRHDGDMAMYVVHLEFHDVSWGKAQKAAKHAWYARQAVLGEGSHRWPGGVAIGRPSGTRVDRVVRLVILREVPAIAEAPSVESRAWCNEASV